MQVDTESVLQNTLNRLISAMDTRLKDMTKINGAQNI